MNDVFAEEVMRAGNYLFSTCTFCNACLHIGLGAGNTEKKVEDS